MAVWCETIKGMTTIPVVVLVVLVIFAVAFVVLAVVLAFGCATHCMHWDMPKDEHADEDDISDDAAMLLSMMPAASVVVDGHGELVRCSPDSYRFGVVRDDAVVNDEILAAIREVRGTGGKKHLDITTSTPERFATKGGVSRPNWLKVVVGALNHGFVVVMINDVSDEVRFIRTRDSFIVSISEQLLAPTHALGALADELERGSLDQQAIAGASHRVRVTCDKLNHMVADLLLLIKAQKPVTPSSANRIDATVLVTDTVERLLAEAERAGVAVHVSGNDHVIINGDASQIDSAVTKLVENAVRYSDPGQSVSVSASLAKDGEHAVIRVIDQGKGISRDEQQHIFERFYRGAVQSKRTEDGVGLGLAIVKHVALTHHGDVTVWSMPGSGSTFTLTLPLAR